MQNAAIESYRAIGYPDSGTPATVTPVEVSGAGTQVTRSTNVS